jgi:magnesium transporter
MNSLETLLRTFAELHPEDAARALESLDPGEATRLLKRLPLHVARRLLEKLSPHVAGTMLQGVGAERAAELLAALGPREASTLLQHLGDEVREVVLVGMPDRTAALLRELASYPEDTAGGMMEARVTALPLDVTVQGEIARLRRAPKETLYYMYVTDRAGKLVGVLSMRELLLASPRDSINQLIRRQVLSVPATLDREEVVALMRERGFLAVPVVDVEGRLLGVVKHDEALEAGQEEAFEDLQKIVGAGADERALSPVSTVVRRRLPWLYVNLVTAFAASAVVGLFEGIIAEVTALAVLLPIVSGQGGNGGSQTLAVVMRGLALREIHPGATRRVIRKELAAAVFNGVAVAVVTAAAVLAWSGSGGLAGVIGLAMVLNMAVAALAGATIPLVLRALGRDPAQSAAIFLTTVTDIVGFGSFLGLAMLFASLLT